MGVEGRTLIGDVNEIREIAKNVKEILPKTFKEFDFKSKIREKFEEYRKKNTLLEDVIQGKGDTTFLKEVNKYTRPRSKAYHPHLERIDPDRLKDTEKCVGDFYEGNLINIVGNPVTTTLATGAFAYGGLDLLRVLAGEGIKKKITRRNFLKLTIGLTGSFAGIAGVLGASGSYHKVEQYKKAEQNAKVLDCLVEKLYPR